MTKKSDTLEHEKGQSKIDAGSRREQALEAVRRLREIGEKLPTVDAAAVVCEGRDLTGRGSR